MTFTLKDLIYVGVYIISFVGVLAGFKYRLQKTEDTNQSLKKIIFLEKGGLNLVTNDVCMGHRNVIHTNIRREAKIAGQAFDQITLMNQNVIKIMMHMKLEPIVVLDRRGSEDT